MDLRTAETKRKAQNLRVAGCLSLLLALATLVATGWTAYSNWLEAEHAATATASARVYLRTLNALLTNVDDAETGQRGFLLTGREHYLAPYTGAIAPIEEDLKVLDRIAIERPQEQASLSKLDSLVHAKMAELSDTIQLRRKEGVNAAVAEVLTDKGKMTMDEIRSICERAAEAQRRAVTEQSRVAADHQLLATRLSFGGGALLLCLMLAGFVALNSGAAQQIRFAENLAESRELFEITLTSIGDGVIATDSIGRITFMNAEAERITGWLSSEAEGKNLEHVFNIISESSRQKAESLFDRVMRTGNVIGLANHTILIRKDFAERAIDDSAAPIRDTQGRISGVVLVFRDISDKRKAETELEHSHKQVLKANEELRQFSYAATHDLQEPLRTIVVFGQLLARSYKDSLDERGMQLVQTVVEAAHRMSTLINDLLAYSQAGGAEAANNLSSVSASDILSDTLVQLHGAIEESGAVVTYDALPDVWSDAAQLSQVFQNLISNSIKYRRPEIKPLIHVSAGLDGKFAVFQVTDNGMGFKPEYADKIFVLFQRLHGRSIPGTGIGLALCRRIIERHGGRIWVKSKEDEGTAFFFTLPVAHEQAATA